ncbi:MAG TPA: hypothetical protein VNC78_01935 [Actinomycetota bacterium]|nr:hypothetical protein [Actinomycetota bacterium]
MSSSLEERIAQAPGTNAGAIFERAGATVVLTRVADVDSSVGLSFLIARSSEPTDSLFVQVPGAREFDTSGGGGVREVHLLVSPTEGGIFRATLLSYDDCVADPGGSCRSPRRSIGTFTIDLDALEVPQAIWEER